MVKLNRLLFLLYLILVLIGLVFITNSSIVDAFREFGNQWQYISKQLVWVVVSLIGYILMSNFSPKTHLAISSKIYWISIFLLLVVLLPDVGLKVQGARRWFNFGFISIQPGEFAKLALVLYLPVLAFLHRVPVGKFLFIGLLPVLLVLIQPDLGTALVLIALVIGIYLISDYPKLLLVKLSPLVLLLFAIYVLMSPYRLNRIKTFLYFHDTQGASYQSNQSQIAIGRGGFFGVGVGQSRQKYNFLPESSTDSIFSIITEETGLLGATFLVVIYVLFISIIFRLSNSVKKMVYSQIIYSVGVLISIQTLLNLGAITGILPLTGIPLPFVSYGGSSLLNFSASIGVVASIIKYET